MVAREIAEQRPDICIQAANDSTLNIGLTTDACAEIVVNTGYYYRLYLDDPTELETYTNAIATPVLSAVPLIGAEQLAVDADALLVLLRPNAYIESFANLGNGHVGVWRRFYGDLIATLAHTQGDQVIYLRRADLNAMGMTEAEAWARAEANVRRRVGPLQRTVTPHHAEHVTASSGLATSELLLPETCRANGPDFDAFVLDRSAYIYADQSKATATTMIAGYAAEMIQTTEAYSETLLSCIDGRWYGSAFNGRDAWLPIEGPQR